MSTNIKVGDRIWRQVQLFGNGLSPQVAEMYTAPADNGGVIVRAEPGDWHFCTEDWVAIPTDHRGLVCFCWVEIPEDTIGFEVIRVNNGGTSCQVKPFSGTHEELLSKYSG